MKFLCAIMFFAAAVAYADAPSDVYGDVPDYGEKYLSPDFVRIGGENIFVSCRTGDEILVVGFDGKIRKRVSTQGCPSGIAPTADGKVVYATIGAPAGKLLKIDSSSGKILAQVPAGHFPRAPQLSPDGKTVYIANQFEDIIRSFDSATLKESAKGSVVREPFAIAVSPDAKKLFVANQLPESKGGLYEENISSAISILDAATLKTIARIDLPNGSINAKDIIVSPDGAFAYCTHIVGRFNVPTTQVERGWIATNAVSVIDAKTNRLIATFLLDDIELGAANPYGINIAFNGKYLLVLHAGTHEMSVINRKELDSRIADAFKKSKDTAKTFEDICNDLAFLSGIRKRVSLEGRGPRHLASSGDFAYVGMYYSDTLNKVNLENFEVSKISLGGNEQMNEIRKGDLYFHDGRMCFQQWLSCSTCHTEVRSDDLNWDLLNDGIGNPKQSKSMLFAHFTPPAMITGIRKDAETAVRKGMQFIQFTRRPEADSVAIDKYLSALKPVPSPKLVNGGLSEAAKRGEMLFEMAKCSHCHAGEYFTDMKKHNVGSGLDEYKDFAFDTPTLREVWRTAPYLYDGRARTIFEMLKVYNKCDRHGETSSFTDEQLRDLEEYVLSL